MPIRSERHSGWPQDTRRAQPNHSRHWLWQMSAVQCPTRTHKWSHWSWEEKKIGSYIRSQLMCTSTWSSHQTPCTHIFLLYTVFHLSIGSLRLIFCQVLRFTSGGSILAHETVLLLQTPNVIWSSHNQLSQLCCCCEVCDWHRYTINNSCVSRGSS